ncbi:MAG: Stp1/IreP family PP2C-type Ser/Thr phosphatase [Gemmatimonadaceae bacterium]
MHSKNVEAPDLVTAPQPSGSTRRDIIVHVFGRTDVGRTREHNEDAFVVADLTSGNATLQPEVRTHTVGDRGSLFMVADGMGGAAAGEIASAMAIEVVLAELTEAFSSADAPDTETYAASIKAATAAANAQIHQYALEHPEFRGMGTTATVAAILGDTLYLAQVGDSRAYLVRNGTALQITKDQSLMQKLIEAGEITEEEAEQSERRNIILQALGPEAAIKIDLTHQQIRVGDTLVLCSDGLSGQVKPDEIAKIVSDEADLMTACKRLIDLANENGGPDNITVIAARFDGEGLSMPGAHDKVGHRVFPLATDSGQVPAARRTTSPSSQAVTAQTPAVRSTARMPSVEIPRPADLLLKPQVSDVRRIKGTMIALGLLLLLLIGATWWVYSTASSVVSTKTAPAAAPTATPKP